MKRSFLITGVSGSGKTTVSKKLNEIGYKAYDIDDCPGLFTMVDKKTGKEVVDHDNKNFEKVVSMEWICSKEKLATIIKNEPSKIAFYCGSASNIDEILPFFYLVILLKVNQGVMRQRLTSRTENDFGCTSEVQDWLMTWKDWWENDMQGKGAIAIDANLNLDEVVKKIIKIAKSVN